MGKKNSDGSGTIEWSEFLALMVRCVFALTYNTYTCMCFCVFQVLYKFANYNHMMARQLNGATRDERWLVVSSRNLSSSFFSKSFQKFFLEIFLVSCLYSNEGFREQGLRNAFEAIDTDRDGFVTLTEFKQLMTK